MARNSYVPRHSSAPVSTSRTGSKIAATVATTLGATAVATTAFAGSAEATTHHTVWDRVANCESSNNWHINTGNGFYGGVQFSSSTWGAYGGHKYANQANHASRLEQIEVARRVLKAQGPGAWPVCGPRAGLTRGSGHATSAALPRVAGSTHTVKKKKHKTVHHKTAHKTVHHKAVHHKATHGHTYKVHSGDTLSKIARKHHVHGGWHALYRANRSHLSNPNVLHVGQVLALP